MSDVTHRIVLLGSSVALLCLIGCGGPSPVELTGKLVLPSEFKLVEDDTIELTLLSETAGTKGAHPKVNYSDLTFASKEVLPGNYKVTLSITPYPGKPESEKRRPIFEKFNKANDMKSTKITFEVTRDAKQSVTFDFVKGVAIKN
ncbi:MAG: hypothetical protein NZO58_11035 [Gemmataceae bacterium]|nr:hypothetical protein [Gemmataceae bacterium]